MLDFSFLPLYFFVPTTPVRGKIINRTIRDFEIEHPFRGNVLCCGCKYNNIVQHFGQEGKDIYGLIIKGQDEYEVV